MKIIDFICFLSHQLSGVSEANAGKAPARLSWFGHGLDIPS